MKVCILTFAVTNNYGATLQCYALSKFIQQQGHETIILNVPLQRAGAPRYKVKLIKRIKNKIHKILFKNVSNERYHRTKEQLRQDNKYAEQNMQLFDVFRENTSKHNASIY